jgi:hypothetical protein
MTVQAMPDGDHLGHDPVRRFIDGMQMLQDGFHGSSH